MEQNSRVEVLDWSSFPNELLDLILDKLSTQPFEYIRFGAVCKSWRSVSVHHKQLRISIINQHHLPLLLITNTPDAHHQPHGGDNLTESAKPCSYKIYIICEHKVLSNYVFHIPYTQRCLGSSHGWLAIGGVNDDDDTPLTLFNPFTGKAIHLPEINRPSMIHKVILSCDPRTCRDDLAVAAMYPLYEGTVAFLKPGKTSWTYFPFYKSGGPYHISDIIFHQGMLYVYNWPKQIFVIDYTRYNLGYPYDKIHRYGYKLNDQFVTGFEVDLIRIRRPDPHCSYLVNASNGDLLFIAKKANISSAEEHTPVTFHVYKLIKKETMQMFYAVEIHELENDDTIFIGDNHFICITSTSSFPDCKPNSIYFIRNFKSGPSSTNSEDDDIGVFRLDDGTVMQPDNLNSLKKYKVPMAWISPTLC